MGRRNAEAKDTYNGVLSENERLVGEMSIMAEIGRVISSTLEIEQIYDSFAMEARKLIPCDQLSVNLIDSTGKVFTIGYVWGLDIPGRRPGDKVQILGSIGEAVVNRRSGILCSFMDLDDLLKKFPHPGTILTAEAGIRSLICVPLISSGAVIGTLHFRDQEPDVYTQRDLQLAERIGRQIAGAVANAQLYANQAKTEAELRASKDATERLTQEAAIITEIGRKISSTIDINEVYERLAAECKKLISYDRMIVNRINAQEGTFTILHVSGMDLPERRPQSSFPLAGTSIADVWKRRAGVIVQGQDETEISSVYPYIRDVLQTGILSLLSVPLIWNDEVIGTMNFRSKKPNAYTAEDLRLAEGIGRAIAGAITNAQLYTDLQKTLNDLEARVRDRTTELEEMNTALRVLLKKGDQDLRKKDNDFMENINQFIVPFLQKLQSSSSVEQQRSYARIIESNLASITSPFLNRLSNHRNLTITETQIVTMVRNGMTSKEIAETMNVSVGTVMCHRHNIRKKLNLKGDNLRSHLLSLI